ncbi:hypothetical protein [Hymenobacter sp. UYCo722]|uniref:hypothetical protein n=1 Tax=Hymenobacter sp. UYCo722 TaxID=3156335 RepID=UPI003399C360
MNKHWFLFACGWGVLAACKFRGVPPTAALEGRWKLRGITDSTFTREGHLRARKELPVTPNSYTHLVITPHHIVYHKRGDRFFNSAQPYTRQGDTLRIVTAADATPADGPLLVTVALLDAHWLVVRLVQPHPPGWRYDYSTYTSYYTR